MATNNTDVVLRYWYQELWDNWNLAAADDLLTDDYRLHALECRFHWTAKRRSKSSPCMAIHFPI